MSQERTYSIGEVSEIMGIPASTIRFYDKKGILPDVDRSEGGMRRFAESDIDWLQMIEHLKMSGMTIAEITEFTSLYKLGDKSIDSRRELVHRRRNEILKQMEELQETLEFITYKCWYYDTASEAGTCDVPREMSEKDMPPEIADILKKCHIRSHRQHIMLPCVDGVKREAKVLSVTEVMNMEKKIDAEGTSLLELMNRAGRALADMAMSLNPNKAKILVLAGSGNNGGDGWVAAHILAESGFDVAVVTKNAPEDLKTEPARTAALEASLANSFKIFMNPDKDELCSLMQSSMLIIDAILGTGFVHEQVRETYAMWINLANMMRQDNGKLIVSADCPSGLNAQNGKHATKCIQADVTVTMLAPKYGLLETNAKPFVGRLVLAPLI